MKKDKPNMPRVKELMDATHKQRREWIEYNAPSVSEVFEEYPSLKHGKVVSIVIGYVHLIILATTPGRLNY
jgi:hypothetical protein